MREATVFATRGQIGLSAAAGCPCVPKIPRHVLFSKLLEVVAGELNRAAGRSLMVHGQTLRLSMPKPSALGGISPASMLNI